MRGAWAWAIGAGLIVAGLAAASFVYYTDHYLVEKMPWLIAVSRGLPPEGPTPTAYVVDEATLAEHGTIRSLLLAVKHGESYAQIETDRETALREFDDFAQALGADPSGPEEFQKILVVFDGEYYEVKAGQPQP